MSRAVEPSVEEEQTLEDDLPQFDEIDKLAELAIGAADIKK